MPILHRGRLGRRLVFLGFAAGIYVLIGGWLFPCPVQTLRGGSSPDLAVMRGDGGTVLWMCLGLSIKEGQCVAGPPWKKISKYERNKRTLGTRPS